MITRPSPRQAVLTLLICTWLAAMGSPVSAGVPWDRLQECLEHDFEEEMRLIASGNPWGQADLESKRRGWIGELEEEIVEELRRLQSERDVSEALLLLIAQDPGTWLPRLSSRGLQSTASRWDPSGRLAVPLASWLLENGRAHESRDWVQKRIVPTSDQPLRDLVLVQVLDALGDSLIAGNMALLLANAQPLHELWSDLALRGSLHLLHQGQWSNAWQLLERHEQRFGESLRSRWLRWRMLKKDPGLDSKEARRQLLMDLSEERLNSHQINALSKDLEKRLEGGWIPPRGKAAKLASLLLKGDRRRGFALILNGLGKESRSEASEVVALAVAYWRRSGEVDRASALADSVISLGDPGTERILLERARIHRGRGDLNAMADDAWRVWRIGRDPELAGLALWELAREMEDERGADSALVVYRSLAGRPGGGRWALQAAQKVGILRFELGRHEDSVTWWDTLGLGTRRAPSASVPHLDVDPRALATGWYWKGRALEAMGDSSRSREAWEEAAGLTSESYYGWLAREALGGDASSDVWTRLEKEARESRSTPATPPGGTVIAWSPPDNWMASASRCRIWTAVGRGEWVRLEWKRAGWDRLERRDRVLLHRASGEDSRSLRLALRLSDREQRQRLSYPASFPRPILEEARRRQLSPFLLWAIMRQESAMDPRAVSRAGAVGLLQIMPTTAVEVSGTWGLDAGPLTSPSCNIALGAAHLAEVLQGGHSVPEALAAYNAGPGPVARWRSKAPSQDLFVEKIGYSETRNYLRRVLRDYGIYRNLYGPGP
jgi:soluble lytic murein transglycosylase-like protein